LIFRDLVTPPLKECFELIVKFHSASVFKRASFCLSPPHLESMTVYLVIVLSLFCFPPGVERVLFWITFIAAPSSTIVIEESALGISQPFDLLCLEILDQFILINNFTLKRPCICVLCPEALRDSSKDERILRIDAKQHSVTVKWFLCQC